MSATQPTLAQAHAAATLTSTPHVDAWPRLSDRAFETRPFHVMAILARAHAVRARGIQTVSMVVGEPDFPTPAPIVHAAQQALSSGQQHYTDAIGNQALRQAIAQDYADRDGLTIDPSRIAVTAGASAALLLTMGAILNPGDEVLIADPGYPCNRQFIAAMGGIPKPIVVSPENHFAPTAEQVAAAWGPKTKALLLASPANPTGCLLPLAQARAIDQVVRAKGGWFIADEIYLRLCFEEQPKSLLQFGEHIISINSFSKTYSMTGWRLGWMVAPAPLIEAVERLAQNLFISPASLPQQAALAAFTPQTRAIVETYRQAYAEQAAYVLPRLAQMGLSVPAKPDGAFYAYCDVSAVTDDSYALCLQACDELGVLMAPGRDFSDHQAERYLRVSFPKPISVLSEGLDRLAGYFLGRKARQIDSSV
ncbi:MAG: aminotransferase class I/II-fold pyridoxal phosphate-dependent enzyme [Burkholderiaceae bacterium]